MNDIQVLNLVKVTHIIDFLKTLYCFSQNLELIMFYFIFKENLIFMILVIGQNNAPDPTRQTNVNM